MNTPMDQEKVTSVLSKIKKLLALSTSNNENESALAASMAQRLMEQHRISEAMLNDSDSADEPIRDWDEPLYAGKNVSTWRTRLSLVLGNANNCKIFLKGGNIKIIGRESDVQTVRYLFLYCEKEIERLSKQYSGYGKTWSNNYKLGCVDAIHQKFKEQRKAVREKFVSEHGAVAEKAIVRVDEKKAELERWVNKHIRLKPRNDTPFRSDDHARYAGQRDGQKIDLTGRGSLASGGRSQLASGKK